MSAWIGCDLDGTLAEYHGSLKGSIGKAIPRMVERIKLHLKNGDCVKIFTARVSSHVSVYDRGYQTMLIQAFCRANLGTILEVTAEKDYEMISCYDDRAVEIVPNTGMTREEYVKQVSR
jgi:hypothetical protein